MGEYALLVAPSSNRVYQLDAPRLLSAELDVVCAARGLTVQDVRTERIGGVEYLLFRADDEQLLAQLVAISSAPFALFAREGELLRPVLLSEWAAWTDDLVSIPKYTGKTNEQFTTLLLNLTLAASARPQLLTGGRGTVLDPVCGRGTTLSIALLRGLDAVGVDVDATDVQAYSTFLKTWARNHRLPHHHSYGPVRRNKKTLAHRLDVELYADRESQKLGRGQRLSVLVTDTAQAPDFVRGGSADVIVGDLPYGVAHGSHRGHDLNRRADDLLERALPAWVRMLRPGGAIGLAFNTRTLRGDLVRELCGSNGLQVVEHGDRFAHTVDSSIHRDLLIATLPKSP